MVDDGAMCWASPAHVDTCSTCHIEYFTYIVFNCHLVPQRQTERSTSGIPDPANKQVQSVAVSRR
jgi:hypothetical protein